MIRFTLFGIPVQVQPWFWLMLVMVGGGLDTNTKEGMIRLLLFMVAGFVSVLVHELGHALTGRAFGARSAITLHAFGGVAEFSGAWFSRKQSFLVTAAGPGVQFLLGVMVWSGILYLGWPALAGNFFAWLAAIQYLLQNPMSPLAGYFCAWLAFISVFWSLLNLVPVLPLDGGQMLNALMGPARVKTTLWVSVITAAVAAIAVIRITGSFPFAILIGFFGYQAWRTLRAESWR